MKKFLCTVSLVALSLALAQNASAQASATQTVTLAVNTVYKISTSGNPGALTVTTGTAGTDALTSVSDNSTTYSITQNFGNTVKMTAYLDVALAAGYTLQVNLASTQGTSAGSVDISNATSGSAVDVVTAISRGADAGQSIGYTFSALASAGTLSSTNKTVTMTITN
ncbi:MAG: hypothetical protein HY562_12460 [Ignavibacteriales bacterium]|nr:hypothetical protein [Ignavibacteriales bacterium]